MTTSTKVVSPLLRIIPSELMAVVGFRSKNAAYKLVERFVQRDWLEKDEAGKLLPGWRFHDLRLLGTVAAGFPSPAEEGVPVVVVF